MRTNTNFMITTLASVGLFFSIQCFAQSPSDAAPDCNSEAALRQVVDGLGSRVEALTAEQREQAKQTVELARVEGGKRGWTAEQQKAVLRETLVSPDYIALEERKAPFRQQIATWARAASSVTTMVEAQSLCQQSAALGRAIDASFAINTLEISIARQMILKHP